MEKYDYLLNEYKDKRDQIKADAQTRHKQPDQTQAARPTKSPTIKKFGTLFDRVKVQTN